MKTPHSPKSSPHNIYRSSLRWWWMVRYRSWEITRILLPPSTVVVGNGSLKAGLGVYTYIRTSQRMRKHLVMFSPPLVFFPSFLPSHFLSFLPSWYAQTFLRPFPFLSFPLHRVTTINQSWSPFLLMTRLPIGGPSSKPETVPTVKESYIIQPKACVNKIA